MGRGSKGSTEEGAGSSRGARSAHSASSLRIWFPGVLAADSPPGVQRHRGGGVLAPLNCAWLLGGSGYRVGGEHAHLFSRPFRASLPELDWIQDGRRAVSTLTVLGWLWSNTGGILTDYQASGIAWTGSRPWSSFIWPCGAGKTLVALCAALASLDRSEGSSSGGILVLAPARARGVWRAQVRQYTTLEACCIAGADEASGTLHRYLEEGRRTGQPSIVVVGHEAVDDHATVIAAYQAGFHPEVLIIDEVHQLGQHRRWQAVPRPDGGLSFRPAKAMGGRGISLSRAHSVMRLSRLSSIRTRIGLTATPLDDGRPRRLWAQLDLIAPSEFGKYWDFARRYCAAVPSPHGGMDDSGASHLDELKARCSFLVHEVTSSEVSAQMPQTRMEVYYLPGELQSRQDGGLVAEEKKATRHGRSAVLEVQLTAACTRKRKYVVDSVMESVASAQKVVVLTARRGDCERTADAIVEAVKGSVDLRDDGVPVWCAHGGETPEERDRVLAQYVAHSGPCVLVGTIQAWGFAVDGLQHTDLALVTMLPWRPGDLVQAVGRFTRLGGRKCIIRIVVAEGTADERVVHLVTAKLGPIEKLTAAEEIRGWETKLKGLEDEAAVLAPLFAEE